MPVIWSKLETLPVLAANQLLAQVDSLGLEPDMVLLTVGHVSPPVVVGSDEQQRAHYAEIKNVAVEPVVRLSISVGRLKEWSALLVQTLAKIEEQKHGRQS